jgi:hypothetical protein
VCILEKEQRKDLRNKKGWTKRKITVAKKGSPEV